MALSYYKEELKKTASSLATSGKGILAVDESTKTIGKRLASINVENTEENRKAYRGLLFTTEGLGEYISGAILFEETLFQAHPDGEPMVKKLEKLGVIPGIKVDKGLRPLAGGNDVETFCSGLDGLVERSSDYYAQGARFAKWRAVLQITNNGSPSKLSIKENAWGLARYARSVQESGLVPIIEPEILMDGSHSINKTAEVQEEVIKEVYMACQLNGVFLEGTLLKPSMTVQGADCKDKADPQKISELTIRTMERCVPASVPGIVFLSGGLSEEAASIYLNLMNKQPRKANWNVGFSYGRALQHSCLKEWGGKNLEAGQKALLARAQANSEASKGIYVAGSQPSSDEALFVAGYKY
ncbi:MULTISPECIES: class I fructose-bisphosphate aldolase [Prochlorococcus]|uniref:Fructose-bisphosphate aldolase n=1 Tax=Prochlorococcus marinus (strain SARG / CCMP1375 / SS120) TaxID=167539 RepID=Q7VC86_PROMA|nr:MULTISPECIES: class I fructose-bisphosphate aldolase [Prochlorococcus]AAP99900.1 Fructose-1,6-bisphosphate aldolase class I [Prochlorococcus marinus subsp. marinus str. CCMP1375]KGG11752.1 Fructose-bisphosphate aldolase class I [Prochlorococcus marinus str. LG]KGG18834.1 Fructose-bisphosphate aldolase class I [Prochlorococcus marinus str. SS2]KGG23628.1 Fructose-bisphosphate aldolase class I [Prochlorococcus marinus str. SS35]KGG32136.1 Fructose-bisphosphate aldolase class I [Prochlorococcu